MKTKAEIRDGILGMDVLTHCRLCPRVCGVNRKNAKGFCGCGISLRAARAQLHHWEEPCISGVNGSGAVFFSGCTLRCCYCQNDKISREAFGKEITPRRLADIFLRLQEEGAHNINLVTATPYLPLIITALDQVRTRLHIPVVYNCGGYERTETVRALKDYVDIWLPDLKYYDSQLSRRFSEAPDYFAMASRAVAQMIEQTGPPVFSPLSPAAAQTLKSTDSPVLSSSNRQIMKQGVIIRHLVLPGHREDSLRLLQWMAHNLPKRKFLISLLSQYTPYRQNPDYPELNRRITSYEYEKIVDAALKLGLDQGFIQRRNSAKEEYTPPFDLQGL